MTTRCLYILLITTASQLFATGGMWDGKWETELIPDFSTSPGVDDMAVPSVIVAGIPKGGTTDFWSVIVGVDPSFRAYTYDDEKNAVVFDQTEKEFNAGFSSGSPLKESKCPANDVRNMLRCPFRVGRLDESPRNMTKCKIWFADPRNIIPRYTIDANPYLMREANPRLFNIIDLNNSTTLCSEEKIDIKYSQPRKPLMLAIVREPVDRTISYFNYFLTRSDTISLELMLEIELGIVAQEKFTAWMHVLKYTRAVSKAHSHEKMFEYAHVIVSAYQHSLQEMEKELNLQKAKYPGKKFEQMGLIMDSIYLPQLLGLIFQRDRTGNPANSNSSWPFLLLQSEYFFSYRAEVFRDAIIPYFHPDPLTRPVLEDNFIDKAEGIRTNTHLRDSPLKEISPEMKKRLQDFYFDLDKNLIETMRSLQQMGRIFVVPKIHDALSDRWWRYN